MLSEAEVKVTKQRNYHRIREIIRVSFGLGVNLTAPSPFKDSLKILNVMLSVFSIIAMYGHWSLFNRHIHNIPKMAETICTALQTMISLVKMIYYLFMQRKFYRLLDMAQTHEILQKIEIFEQDFAIKKQLKFEANDIMEGIWKGTRTQAIFYLCCCSAICSNYFFVALGVNLYHDFKDTPDYVPLLPFPALYPKWEDKGLAFPYYHLQMLLETAALYISGMCAISFDSVFIVLCLHGVGIIEVLKASIRHVTSPQVPKNQRLSYLRCCIFQYQRIHEYVKELNYTYKQISITQFLFSLIVLGIVLFQIGIGLESDWSTLIRMLLYLSAAGYEVVLYCYNGQRLITASEEIPLAFYSCEWYNESVEFKQMIRMMIMRTNRHFHLDISWFFPMALPTLMSFIRTSGSYFLLLRHVAQ